MNSVFAEECSGLRAGVSPQPADLSTAAVFMLRLVPQLSLPVVLPVFLFPNSSSHSPWFLSPRFQLSFFFAAVSFFQNMIRAAHMPQGSFSSSELTQMLENMSCQTASWAQMWCTVHTPENTSEDTSVSTTSLFPLRPLHSYKTSMHAIDCIIDCELITAQYSPNLTSH